MLTLAHTCQSKPLQIGSMLWDWCEVPGQVSLCPFLSTSLELLFFPNALNVDCRREHKQI